MRVHSKCLTGDVFHSARCDCGPQLQTAMERIAAEGRGVLLYLNQEGRGIGLANKIRAYELQDQGLDTVEANERLGLQGRSARLRHRRPDPARPGRAPMRLLTNNPSKFIGLDGYGLSVVGVAAPGSHPGDRVHPQVSEDEEGQARPQAVVRVAPFDHSPKPLLR